MFPRDALDYLKQVFTELILDDQECFREEKGWEELLQLIPDHSIVDDLRRDWSKDPHRPSADKWEDLKHEVRTSRNRVCYPVQVRMGV